MISSGTAARGEEPLNPTNQTGNVPQQEPVPPEALVAITRARKVGEPHAIRISASESEFIQSVIDAFPFYVMLVDAEHRILATNAAVQSSLGVGAHQILGQHCPKVVHGEDGPYIGCPLEKARRVGHAVEIEHLDKKTERILRSGIYPTRYETTPGCTVYLHTVRDVTEQRIAEKRVRRSNEAQRFVNDILRISLMPLSLDEILDRVVERVSAIPWLANDHRAAIFLTDESGKTLRLKASRGLGEQRKGACEVIAFGKCLCGKAASTRSIQFAREVGEEHTIVDAFEPGHGHYCIPIVHSNNVLGVLNTTVDEGHERTEEELEFLQGIADALAGIIERKRVEDLQRKHHSVAIARERMARVGELSAGVAHTVRNPLHGVMGCVDILQGHAERQETVPTDILALMRDGLERIEKVTRRLLALTRGGVTEQRPTNVGSLLKDLVDFMSIQAEKKGVRLQLEADFEGEALICADGVVEGLSSVVSNALDACSRGNTVTLRSKQVARRLSYVLVLEVEDDGSGIPASDLPRVLDPFYTTKPIGEGSGLGLAITRRVMDEHGGDVEVSSVEGEGTTVRLVFPEALVTVPASTRRSERPPPR